MKSIVLMLTLIMATFSYADCIDKYKSERVDSFYNRLSSDEASALNATTLLGGLVAGSVIAGGTVAGGMITMGVMVAPITVGIIIRSAKNRKENRMIRLIKQSYKYAEQTSQKPKRLLRKLHKKIKKVSNEITVEQLAQAIIRGNEDMSLCENSAGLRELKRGTFDGQVLEIN